MQHEHGFKCTCLDNENWALLQRSSYIINVTRCQTENLGRYSLSISVFIIHFYLQIEIIWVLDFCHFFPLKLLYFLPNSERFFCNVMYKVEIVDIFSRLMFLRNIVCILVLKLVTECKSIGIDMFDVLFCSLWRIRMGDGGYGR